MDVLKEILDTIYIEVTEINNQLGKNNISIINLENILNKLDEYDNNIQKFHKLFEIINNLRNNLKVIYNNKILNIKNKINLYNSEDISPFLSDYTVELKNITNLEKFKNKSYTKCPVITISNSQLPNIINSPIYYIKDTKEYCIKINNKLIKGNIGNIFDDNNKESNKIKKCNKLYCNNTFFNKKECKFYHENQEIRNFPNYSWKHIQKNKLGKLSHINNNINYNKYDLENTRFIGSLDSLSEDLIFTNNYEKELRNKQLMHDILIYQLLDQYLEL
jgi:hypothetical protein